MGRRRWFACVALVALSATACAAETEPEPLTPAERAAVESATDELLSTYTYTVDGTVPTALLTMHTPDGQVQRTVTLPWTETFTRESESDSLWLMAASDEQGQLDCAITDDSGAVLDDSSLEGLTQVVTCEL